MKTFVILAFAAVTMAACTKQAEQKTEPVGEVVSKDLICQMEGKKEIFHVYEGKTYLFCNDGCKEAFIKEPAKYLTVATPTDSTASDSSKKM